MMKMNKNLVLLIFLLISMFFIGLGATGMVVSQSCCFPPGCGSVEMCDIVNLEEPSIDNAKLYFGLGLFISTTITYMIINRK